MKRLFTYAGVSALALFAVVAGVWIYIGRSGGTGLEQWIGGQIVGVLESHITPKVAFKRLDYQAPKTVVIDELTLTSEGHSILAVKRALLELAEVPSEGKPILIQRIELDGPNLQFLTDAHGDFIGWDHFVRQEVIAQPESVPPGRRLSDVLVLRHVVIRNGQVLYDDALDGTEPMTLPGIELNLETPPDAAAPGWYRLAGSLKRDPIFRLDLDGRINLDTALLAMNTLKLTAALGPEQYGSVPPQLQRLLKQHEVAGAVTINLSGEIPLNDPTAAKAKVHAELDHGRFAYGGLIIPVGKMTVNAGLPEAVVDFLLAEAGMESEGRPVITLGQVAARLSGKPWAGEPVRIERLSFDRPRVNLVAAPGGGFVGFNQAKEIARDEPHEAPDTQPAAMQVAQAVRLDRLEVRNAAFGFDPDASTPDDEIQIEDISMDLGSTPVDGRPGQYRIEAKLVRKSLIEGTLAGVLDLAGGMFKLERFNARAQLNKEAYAALPPTSRDTLTRHGLAGDVVLEASAALNLRDPRRSEGQAKVSLDKLSFLYNGLIVPIERLRGEVALPDGRLQLAAEGLGVFDGELALLEVPRLSVECASVLRRPLSLDRIRVEQPSVRLAVDREGRLQGWAGGSAGATTQPAAAKPAAAAPAASRPAGRSPSIPAIKALEIVDALIRYEPAERKPVEIAKVNLALKAGTVTGEGWQPIEGQLRQEPLADVGFAGRIHLGQGLADLANLSARTRLAVDDPAAAALADLIDVDALAGDLGVEFKGLVPLADLMAAKGTLRFQAKDAAWRDGPMHLRLAAAQGTVAMPEGQVAVTAEQVRIGDGREELIIAQRVNLELPRIPAEGRPTRLSKLLLESPRLLLDGNKPGMGLAALTAEEPRREAGAAATAPARQAQPRPQAAAREARSPRKAAADAGPIIDQLQVRGGSVVYRSGSEPLEIVGLELDAALPATDAEGFMPVNLRVGLASLAKLELGGRWHRERSLLEVQKSSWSADFGPAGEAVPKGLQAAIGGYDLAGQWEGSFAGRVPLERPMETAGRFDLRVRGGQVAVGSMTLPIGDAEVHMEPAKDGWHTITARAKRDPMMNLVIDGRLKPGEQLLELAEARLNLNLTAEHYALLSKAMQKTCRDHELTGRIQASARGRISFREPAAALGQATINVNEARMLVGDMVWPVQRLELTANLAGRAAQVQYSAQLLGGSGQGSAQLALDGDQPFQGNWTFGQIRLQDTLRVMQGGRPRYSGVLTTSGQVTGKAAAIGQSLGGNGTLSVVDGNLITLPIVSQILGAINRTPLPVDRDRDEARLEFTLHPDHVMLTKAELDSPLIVLRGQGRVFYDNRLELDVHAQSGVLEEVTSRLGQVGRFLDTVNKHAVTYGVTGTTDNPRLTVKPLGMAIR